jgi:long-chain acyl-CoA synthetase
MSMLWPILRQALAHPRRQALLDDQGPWSYAKLLGASLFLAHAIEARSDQPNVGLLLPTGALCPAAILAAWLARRAAIPFNYLLAPDDLRFVIQDSGVDLILTVKPMLDFLNGDAKPDDAGQPQRPPMIPRHVELLPLESLDFTGIPPLRWPPLPDGQDTAVILYTSGTSGKPKGVMLTHRNLRTDADAAIEHAQLTKADTFLGVLPQFHSFGLTALTLIPLMLGSRIIYTARFVPKKIIQLIRAHRPGIFMAIPSMYGALLTVKDAAPEDFASIRLPISGGEPLPQSVHDQCRDRFNLQLLEGYGLTETAPATHWSTPFANKPHSVGRQLPCVTTLIVDAHDNPAPVNHEGEILLAGPNVMKGYYHQPDLTAQVFVDLPAPDSATLPGVPRRFFRTGDIGRVDEDGYLFITGRKKEMLIIAGENVFPREIEEVLNQHPSVQDSAVVGQPDALRGEIAIAYVELKPDTAFDGSALRQWCRERLPQYKVPREVKHLEKLPRSPTGKILRRELKE